MTSTQLLIKPTLEYGSTGSAVKELQRLLNGNVYDLKFSLVVDGTFGALTQQAVTVYQYQVFLTPNGIVGNRTWRSLYKQSPVDMPVLQMGSVGQAVSLVQELLKENGYYVHDVDGVFGSWTEVAVTKFQTSILLEGTGIVDENTWYQMSKYLRRSLPQ